MINSADIKSVIWAPSNIVTQSNYQIKHSGRIRRVMLDPESWERYVVIGGKRLALDEDSHKRMRLVAEQRIDPGYTPPVEPVAPPVPETVRVRYLNATGERPARIQTRNAHGKIVIADMPDTCPTAKQMQEVSFAVVRDFYSHAEATHTYALELFPYHATIRFTPKATV
ncbi:hypothetical protein CMP1-65 [Clavibacter phage CMP1]|uniref:Uncharacterized protein n=1 Tax=Clavibacter phage CMP1 TaxID=686439 RepID=D0U249_9CAUD|nr:hypothetical protein CMP1-65 [Clavibacter phage CMP1]ACY35957.1 hypothetical protein CMP1-65 [Clavibacter phage CMP1]